MNYMFVCYNVLLKNNQVQESQPLVIARLSISVITFSILYAKVHGFINQLKMFTKMWPYSIRIFISIICDIIKISYNCYSGLDLLTSFSI